MRERSRSMGAPGWALFRALSGALTRAFTRAFSGAFSGAFSRTVARELPSTLLGALLLLTAACGGAIQAERPDGTGLLEAQVIRLLEQAEHFEVLALDPLPLGIGGKEHGSPGEGPADTFHGHGVRGRKGLIDPSARVEVLRWIYQGLRSGQGIPAHGCYAPRHGIRAVHGEEWVELGICYECFKVRIYGSWLEHYDEVPTAEGAGTRLTQVFEAHGLQVAGP